MAAMQVDVFVTWARSSSVSPTNRVDSLAFMSRSRSIESSRSLMCVSYLYFSDFSASCISGWALSSPLFSSARSSSAIASASATASLC